MNDLSTVHTASASRRQACIKRLWQGGFHISDLAPTVVIRTCSFYKTQWWCVRACVCAYVSLLERLKKEKKKKWGWVAGWGEGQTIFCIFIQQSVSLIGSHRQVSRQSVTGIRLCCLIRCFVLRFYFFNAHVHAYSQTTKTHPQTTEITTKNWQTWPQQIWPLHMYTHKRRQNSW